MSVEVFVVPGGVEVYRDPTGGLDVVVAGGTDIFSEAGIPGADAQAWVSTFIAGLFPANGLIAGVSLAGSGQFTAAESAADPFTPAAAPTTWSVTKNGTFANPLVATPAEIAASLFATIAFPAGPGVAVWTYPTGGGFADKDLLRIWQSPLPDGSLNYVATTFAGS